MNRTQSRPMSKYRWCAFLMAQAWFCLGDACVAERPNVVLIMSDDQGYGDFGATGNKLIETPHIDAMAARSASMNTFYVSPVCSPTRACLMTGRYNYRTRCIDTYIGRSMMEPEEVTVAEVLRDAGYATGIFGKWHLGDCYPMRPMDQGFTESLVLRGGGLAQPSEPLENQRRYTDAVLFRNGEQVETEGYCTDVYVDAAVQFIERSEAENRRFFAYIATNAPHGPFHDVPPDLFEHYQNVDFSSLAVETPNGKRSRVDQNQLARIAAMITNIDQNVGRLFQRLEELALIENTIVIYMVDNGPNSMRYVGPLRGMKSDVDEGGVRSPFWMHWPAELPANASSDAPVAHIDVMPTILDACEVDPPAGVRLDGRSFLQLLRNSSNPSADGVDWAERPLVIQSHRGDMPQRYHHAMIRRGRWKLVHPSGFGKQRFEGDPKFELYDLQNDPGERNDLAAQRPEHVARLRGDYDRWFDDVSSTRPDNYAPPRIHVGAPQELTTVLTRQDARQVAEGQWDGPRGGQWLVHVVESGLYDVQAIFTRDVPAGRVQIEIGDAKADAEMITDQRRCQIDGILLKAGDATVRATAVCGDKPFGAYQLLLTPRT